MGPEAPPRTVYRIQPLQDPRWAEFVDRHPRSSVFHTVAWIEALRRTYGFEPVVYTTSPPGVALENGVALCRVQSWVTGRRLVSLPFSDHCQPLVDDAGDARRLTDALAEALRTERLRYVEVRGGPLPAHLDGPYRSTQDYVFHELSLQPGLETLFGNFHKSSTQRKILRAEREKLTYESGRSRALLDAFWDLLLMTRRRHGIPPQPRIWFRNLIECFGEALQIRVALYGKRPAAAMLTIRHKDKLVYKYGCSDERLSPLGGTQLLFWRSIQEAKGEGLRGFDLGRSDCDNPGLITFKDRWGSTRSTLTYTRFSASPKSGAFGAAGPGRAGQIAKGLTRFLPDSALRLAGSVLYRHIA
jgi:CelD/BcsL family acetyltransferase involved in cellulose biosynthesis